MKVTPKSYFPKNGIAPPHQALKMAPPTNATIGCLPGVPCPHMHCVQASSTKFQDYDHLLQRKSISVQEAMNT